ncbi:MAG: MgtC/SapB family protein [Eubacterium sp.]
MTSLKGFLIHLMCAAALGSVIGFERQWTHHQAGILTNLIVCLGSFAFTSFGYLLTNNSVDLTRIAAQVVSGVGFLGAGVILRDGGNVKGLNTAATVWASAAVGILCCLTNLTYAILVAFAIVILHLLLHPFSSWINKIKKYDKSERKKSRRKEALYKISVSCPEDAALEVRKSIINIIKDEPEALLHTLESSTAHSDEHNKKIRAYITTKTENDALIESLITKVGKNEEIISAGWKIEND